MQEGWSSNEYVPACQHCDGIVMVVVRQDNCIGCRIFLYPLRKLDIICGQHLISALDQAEPSGAFLLIDTDVVSGDILPHQGQRSGKEDCGQHDHRQEYICKLFAVRELFLPLLGHIHLLIQLYQIIRNDAAGQRKPYEQELVIVIGIGLEQNKFTDEPYEQSAAVEQLLVLIGAEERREHEYEYQTHILNVEPQIAVALIVPVELPTQEAVI